MVFSCTKDIDKLVIQESRSHNLISSHEPLPDPTMRIDDTSSHPKSNRTQGLCKASVAMLEFTLLRQALAAFGALFAPSVFRSTKGVILLTP